MQYLALLELHNGLDLLIDFPLLRSEGGVGGEEILLELVDAVVGEVLVHSALGEEELKFQEEADELIVAHQLLPFCLGGLVEDVLLHHVLVVLLEDVLDLLEVLLPAVG